MGSAMELKRLLPLAAHTKIKPHYAGKDWEIVAMTAEYLVLRIERENIKFKRATGAVLERFNLGPKKP
jgi:hypothetical protein